MLCKNAWRHFHRFLNHYRIFNYNKHTRHQKIPLCNFLVNYLSQFSFSCIRRLELIIFTTELPRHYLDVKLLSLQLSRRFPNKLRQVALHCIQQIKKRKRSFFHTHKAILTDALSLYKNTSINNKDVLIKNIESCTAMTEQKRRIIQRALWKLFTVNNEKTSIILLLAHPKISECELLFALFSTSLRRKLAQSMPYGWRSTGVTGNHTEHYTGPFITQALAQNCYVCFIKKYIQ